jgi:energy-coupling factor transport system substrate-specific component
MNEQSSPSGVRATAASDAAPPTPSCGGTGFFGARFSLYPMTDRFVPVILNAIEGLRDGGLVVETDDVSTFLGGHPETVFRALRRAFARAAAGGDHVVMPVLFSYG